MCQPVTIINGHLYESDTTISVTDRAFNYADGLFETMRLIDGRIPLFPLHMNRLLRGIDVLGLRIDRQAIESHWITISEKYFNGLNGAIKLMLCRNGEGVAGYVSSQQGVDIVIRWMPLPTLSKWYQPPVSLVTADGRLSHNKQLAGLKHISRLDYIVAAAGRVPSKDSELLFLDIEERVIETMRHNIFCVCDGEIWTPTVDQVGVSGVMRQMVQRVLDGRNNLNIGEISYDQLVKSEEVFLTNALRGIVPVTKIDNYIFRQHGKGKQIADRLASDISG